MTERGPVIEANLLEGKGYPVVQAQAAQLTALTNGPANGSAPRDDVASAPPPAQRQTKAVPRGSQQ